MSELPVYEVVAVKYARHEREPSLSFMHPVDLHESEAALDFFVWAVISDERTFVVDTGFNAETAQRRGRELIRCPAEGLRLIDIEAETVADVIVTHLHYDHVGNFDLFPKATYHLQDREMAYATGRNMTHSVFSAPYDVDHVIGMVKEVYAGRVNFIDGDAELTPGLSLHHIGGHTDGLMCVRVHTARGWIVLASDTAHLYANMNAENPFPIVYNVGDMVRGFRKLRSLADTNDHIIPGHDPLVMKRYPAFSSDLEGIAVRLDIDPTFSSQPASD